MIAKTAKPKTAQSSSAKVRELCVTAVCIVLVYVFTAMVNITFPGAGDGGLMHMGNIPLFIVAILFGRKTGAIAGGVGMALFDLLSPFAIWAPFTLVIVGLMGYVVGAVAEKHRSILWYLLAMVLACAIKVGGYYIAEGIIYGNWIAPVVSIPANIIQVAVGAAVTLLVIKPLQLAADKTLHRV
jgi:uncharacterized membrane protein